MKALTTIAVTALLLGSAGPALADKHWVPPSISVEEMRTFLESQRYMPPLNGHIICGQKVLLVEYENASAFYHNHREDTLPFIVSRNFPNALFPNRGVYILSPSGNYERIEKLPPEKGICDYAR